MKNFIWGSRLLLAHTLPSPAIALILMVSDSSKCSSHCKCIPGKKADEKDNFKGISQKLPKHICSCAGLAPWACNQYSYMRPVGLGLVLYSHHLDFLKFMFEFVLCKWSSNGKWRMSTFCLFLFPQDYVSTASPSLPVPWAVSASPSPVPPSGSVHSCSGPCTHGGLVSGEMSQGNLGQGLATAVPTLRCQCQSTQSRTHWGLSNSLTFTIKTKTIPVHTGRNTLGSSTSAVGEAAGL